MNPAFNDVAPGLAADEAARAMEVAKAKATPALEHLIRFLQQDALRLLKVRKPSTFGYNVAKEKPELTARELKAAAATTAAAAAKAASPLNAAQKRKAKKAAKLAASAPTAAARKRATVARQAGSGADAASAATPGAYSTDGRKRKGSSASTSTGVPTRKKKPLKPANKATNMDPVIAKKIAQIPQAQEPQAAARQLQRAQLAAAQQQFPGFGGGMLGRTAFGVLSMPVAPGGYPMMDPNVGVAGPMMLQAMMDPSAGRQFTGYPGIALGAGMVAAGQPFSMYTAPGMGFPPMGLHGMNSLCGNFMFGAGMPAARSFPGMPMHLQQPGMMMTEQQIMQAHAHQNQVQMLRQQQLQLQQQLQQPETGQPQARTQTAPAAAAGTTVNLLKDMSWQLLVEPTTPMHGQLVSKGFLTGWNSLHDKQPWPHDPIVTPVSGSARMYLNLIVRPSAKMRQAVEKSGTFEVQLCVVGAGTQIPLDLKDWGMSWIKCTRDRTNRLEWQGNTMALAMTTSQANHFHPALIMSAMYDCWITMWFNKPVGPVEFCIVSPELGQHHQLHIPFVATTLGPGAATPQTSAAPAASAQTKASPQVPTRTTPQAAPATASQQAAAAAVPGPATSEAAPTPAASAAAATSGRAAQTTAVAAAAAASTAPAVSTEVQ